MIGSAATPPSRCARSSNPAGFFGGFTPYKGPPTRGTRPQSSGSQSNWMAEYSMSFFHLCSAVTLRTVPDFDRVTREWVMAPLPV